MGGRRALAVVSAFAILSAAGGAGAEEGVRPIQVALFHPAQIFHEETSVHGLRLNLLYGANREVRGLDLGLANHAAREMVGVQYGLVNFVEGRMRGWQQGGFNYNEDGVGIMLGFYNGGKAFEGFQWGAVNIVEEMRGVQLGVFNMTQSLHGLQVGIVNVVRLKEDLPILPVVNWSF